MPQPSPSFTAEGDIRPSRFVKIGAADFACLEADANNETLGIAHEGTEEAPIPSVSTNLAASSGGQLRVYGEGEECLLELGSGGATLGGKLKSDADGKGVDIATTGTTIQYYGAVALEAGSAGDLIRVIVQRGSVRPALS